MCGILAIARLDDRPLDLTDNQGRRMRDTLAHRGPDGQGLWRTDGVALAQRRLEVIAPGHAGHQPMHSADGRWSLVYNGEAYNDAELRESLGPAAPRSPCDTATIVQLLQAEGPDGLSRIRGMFAIAAYDHAERRLVLARDPLGIKPLVYGFADGGRELVAASEVAAIFAHPGISPAIDPLGVSAYLTTIRTATAGRTMFEGVRMLQPGEVLEFDLRTGASRGWRLGTEADAATPTREALVDSVRAHLRADAPVCSLLSGGLDSAIITGIARGHEHGIATFTAGDDAADGGKNDDADPAHARRLAEEWGLPLAEVRLDAGGFVRGIETLIERTGQPVGTPNEAAIHALGCAMRARGYVVTLSGEGADELFGGYHGPLSEAAAHVDAGDRDPGLHHLLSAAWMTPEATQLVLAPHLAQRVQGDAWLVESYRAAFEEEAARPGPAVASPRDAAMRAHMRFLRRINLTGLLQRLDSTLSQSGIEGRVPFADRRVWAHADALATECLFDPTRPPHEGTKIALRRAFAGDLPERVLSRPKASFPLPFQRWLPALVARIDGDPIVRDVVAGEAWELVRGDPATHWRLAWPMANVALWARRWFG
ncbi:MAG: asparagine synthase (glutamine-hydrolyzing) [Planctomycetota bacterium]